MGGGFTIAEARCRCDRPARMLPGLASLGTHPWPLPFREGNYAKRSGGFASRVSGISRLSLCAKLLRQTSLLPNGPGA
jgi:hypothetical protein